MALGDTVGIGLPGRQHIVGVVWVGDGRAVRCRDLRGDGGKVLFGKLIGEDKAPAGGRHQLFVRLRLIDQPQIGGIIHGSAQLEISQLGVVHERQGDERYGGHQCACYDERCAPTLAMGTAVGDMAEQRQQEQCQHIVQRHDNAGPGLAHAELVGEDQGDRVVIGLPEGADQEKGEAHQNGAFVIEFHDLFSFIAR